MLANLFKPPINTLKGFNILAGFIFEFKTTKKILAQKAFASLFSIIFFLYSLVTLQSSKPSKALIFYAKRLNWNKMSNNADGVRFHSINSDLSALWFSYEIHKFLFFKFRILPAPIRGKYKNIAVNDEESSKNSK